MVPSNTFTFPREYLRKDSKCEGKVSTCLNTYLQLKHKSISRYQLTLELLWAVCVLSFLSSLGLSSQYWNLCACICHGQEDPELVSPFLSNLTNSCICLWLSSTRKWKIFFHSTNCTLKKKKVVNPRSQWCTWKLAFFCFFLLDKR
jgi:hypothetical protein